MRRIIVEAHEVGDIVARIAAGRLGLRETDAMRVSGQLVVEFPDAVSEESPDRGAVAEHVGHEAGPDRGAVPVGRMSGRG